MVPFSAAHYQSIPYARGTYATDDDPLAAFFALYHPFKYNPAASSPHEYRRLCAFFGWPTLKQQERHAERDEAWERFRMAMVEAFNKTFGTDENDIEAWGRMCVLVGMEPIPDTLGARREVRNPFSFILRCRRTFLIFLVLSTLLFGCCVIERCLRMKRL